MGLDEGGIFCQLANNFLVTLLPETFEESFGQIRTFLDDLPVNQLHLSRKLVVVNQTHQAIRGRIDHSFQQKLFGLFDCLTCSFFNLLEF